MILCQWLKIHFVKMILRWVMVSKNSIWSPEPLTNNKSSHHGLRKGIFRTIEKSSHHWPIPLENFGKISKDENMYWIEDILPVKSRRGLVRFQSPTIETPVLMGFSETISTDHRQSQRLLLLALLCEKQLSVKIDV